MIDLSTHEEYPAATNRSSHAMTLGWLGLVGLGLLLVSPARRMLTSRRGLDTVFYALRRSSVPIPFIAGLASLLGLNREEVRRTTDGMRRFPPHAF